MRFLYDCLQANVIIISIWVTVKIIINSTFSDDHTSHHKG